MLVRTEEEERCSWWAASVEKKRKVGFGGGSCGCFSGLHSLLLYLSSASFLLLLSYSRKQRSDRAKVGVPMDYAEGLKQGQLKKEPAFYFLKLVMYLHSRSQERKIEWMEHAKERERRMKKDREARLTFS
jgi:hypothetical protein